MRPPPSSTKDSLTWRLREHARDHWPDLVDVQVRFRANFAYVDGHDANGDTLKLCRLRYNGSATTWGFGIYRASHDDYEDSFLPNGLTAGTPQDALDCACNLYLQPHTTTRNTPTN